MTEDERYLARDEEDRKRWYLAMTEEDYKLWYSREAAKAWNTGSSVAAIPDPPVPVVPTPAPARCVCDFVDLLKRGCTCGGT